MDAVEFFEKIAKPNYDEAKKAPDDLRLLWNAVFSLNTIAEFVVLHRCNYETDLDCNELFKEAEQIRKKIPELDYLNKCAIAFKHVRRNQKKTQHNPFDKITATPSSTGIDPSDPSTWSIEIDGLQRDVVTVLHNAFPEAENLINSLGRAIDGAFSHAACAGFPYVSVRQ
jgi:hypothetical protein